MCVCVCVFVCVCHVCVYVCVCVCVCVSRFAQMACASTYTHTNTHTHTHTHKHTHTYSMTQNGWCRAKVLSPWEWAGKHATNSNMLGCIVLAQMHVMLVCIRFMATCASISPFVSLQWMRSMVCMFTYMHTRSVIFVSLPRSLQPRACPPPLLLATC